MFVLSSVIKLPMNLHVGAILSVNHRDFRMASANFNLAIYSPLVYAVRMGHLHSNSKKLVSRIRRIQGQLEGVIKSIESDDDCFRILQNASACRGALNGLIYELIDDHIQSHIVGAKTSKDAQKASAELSRILKTYLK